MFGYWHVVEPAVEESIITSSTSLPPLSADWGVCANNKAIPQGWKGDLMWTSNTPSLLHPTSTVATTASSATSSLSSQSKVTDLIVMLPGNPGVVDWYKEMATKLETQSRGKVAVLTVGFLGHHSGRISSSGGGNGVALLQEQIEAIDVFIGTVIIPSITKLNNNNAKKITLHVAGHSIGSFVAAHMAARHPCGINGKCFLLTPTLCNMLQSPNGAMNDKFVNWLGINVASTLAAVASRCVPMAVQRGVIKCLEKTPMQAEHLEIALGMGRSCPGMLQSMLWLARSEFDQLTSLDPHLLGLVGAHRTVAYFVETDGWVPHSDIALFRQNCALGSQIILEENPLVPHAFVLGFVDAVIQNGIAPFVEALQ